MAPHVNYLFALAPASPWKPNAKHGSYKLAIEAERRQETEMGLSPYNQWAPAYQVEGTVGGWARIYTYGNCSEGDARAILVCKLLGLGSAAKHLIDRAECAVWEEAEQTWFPTSWGNPVELRVGRQGNFDVPSRYSKETGNMAGFSYRQVVSATYKDGSVRKLYVLNKPYSPPLLPGEWKSAEWPEKNQPVGDQWVRVGHWRRVE